MCRQRRNVTRSGAFLACAASRAAAGGGRARPLPLFTASHPAGTGATQKEHAAGSRLGGAVGELSQRLMSIRFQLGAGCRARRKERRAWAVGEGTTMPFSLWCLAGPPHRSQPPSAAPACQPRHTRSATHMPVCSAWPPGIPVGPMPPLPQQLPLPPGALSVVFGPHVLPRPLAGFP